MEEGDEDNMIGLDEGGYEEEDIGEGGGDGGVFASSEEEILPDSDEEEEQQLNNNKYTTGPPFSGTQTIRSGLSFDSSFLDEYEKRATAEGQEVRSSMRTKPTLSNHCSF